MVERQVELRGIKDPRVLSAMRRVDRTRFVPPELQEAAYDDRALPIGYGQTISQPYVVALMSELLELHGQERVLEIGTGSGYQAAILAELARDVYTIEIVPELAAKAKALLTRLGYHQVHVEEGDGAAGWPEMAPFDAIIVTCAPDQIPPALFQQLREGGRLVVPVGPRSGAQMLYQYRKVSGKIVEKPVVPVSFVPMTGKDSH